MKGRGGPKESISGGNRGNQPPQQPPKQPETKPKDYSTAILDRKNSS